MANIPARATTDLREKDDHRFLVSGTAPFLKCVRNASLSWTMNRPLTLRIDSGICAAGESITLLQKGTYQLSPFEPVELTAAFKSPVYLLTTAKIFEILCRRYSLIVKLYSKWELNIWPLFLDYYLQNGRWPDTIECMRELGGRIIAEFRQNGLSQRRGLSKFQRARKEIPIVLMTRLNGESTLRDWAKKHWASVYRKFFNSPSFEEMDANAVFMKSLRDQGEGLAALKSVARDDDLAFAMPFELAAAESLECNKTIGVTRNEGSKSPARRNVVTSLQLNNVCMAAIPLPVTLKAERLQVPLVSGAKRAYGAVMTSPIIAKGINVSGDIEGNQPKVDRRLKTTFLKFLFPQRIPAVSENPADLRLQMTGDEA